MLDFLTRDLKKNNKKQFPSIEIGNDILIYIIFVPYALLSHSSEYNMANVFRVSHILTTYFTSLQVSEIKAKYEKRGKH